MLPLNQLSSEQVKGKFTPPYDFVRSALLEDYQIGGVALADPSAGHRVQAWYGRCDPSDGKIYLRPSSTGVETLVHTQLNVFEFSFAFDQNMQEVVMTTLTSGLSRLRWYDATVPGYVVTEFTDMHSCRLVLDDTRTSQIQRGTTDVILTYFKTSTNQLCFRAQRDRYATEYVLSSDLPSGLLITNFGMTDARRIQWRLQQRTFEERLPWLP